MLYTVDPMRCGNLEIMVTVSTFSTMTIVPSYNLTCRFRYGFRYRWARLVYLHAGMCQMPVYCLLCYILSWYVKYCPSFGAGVLRAILVRIKLNCHIFAHYYSIWVKFQFAAEVLSKFYHYYYLCTWNKRANQEGCHFLSTRKSPLHCSFDRETTWINTIAMVTYGYSWTS